MLNKKDYIEKIKKCRTNIKLWILFAIICNTIVYFLNKPVNYLVPDFMYVTGLSLIGIIINIQDMRFYTECIKRILEKEKFERRLREVSSKFYTVFDDMCSKEMSFSKICKKQYAPIIPSDTVMKWQKSNDPNTIIGYWAEDNSPYEIICPEQLRDMLVKLQNNL